MRGGMKTAKTVLLLIIQSICFSIITTIVLLMPGHNQESIAEVIIQEKSVLDLTEQEKAWLAEHPIIEIGVMNSWPPMNYDDKNGNPKGIGASFTKALNRRLGGAIHLKSGSWSEIYEAVKERRLAGLMGITPRTDREEIFNFTTSYVTVPHIIITRKDSPNAQRINDLAGKSIAIEKGFFIIGVLKKKNIGIKIQEYQNTSDALDAVSKEKAYAYIGNRAVARFIIEQELISNLQMQGKITETASVNAIGIRKDWPVLKSIMQKALNSLTFEERRSILKQWILPEQKESAEIDNRWHNLPKDRNADITERNVNNTLLHLFRIGLSLFIIVASILLLFRLLDRSKKDPLAYQFSSPAGKRIVVMSNALLILLVIVLGWWALNNIKSNIKEDMYESLKTVNQTTLESLNIWVNDHKGKLNNIATDPHVVELSTGLLKLHEQKKDLLSSPELEGLRNFFINIQRLYNHIGFFVIAADGTSVGSLRDSNVGSSNLIYQQRPDLLERVFNGETVLIPPIPSDVPLKNTANITGLDRPPTMFFAAPIRNPDGKIIAAITERFNPHGDFSRINQLGRIGKSGKTYSFNRQGRLLSESRFLNHLKSTKLLQPEDQGILSISIKDPGGNLVKGFQNEVPREKLSLTRMAASAVKGESGIDINGYRDYRGVKVIGVWDWNEALGIGMATELDVADAMKSYYSARLAVLVVLGFSVAVSIIFTLLIMILASRANKALKIAHDQLEDRVKERTSELSDAKKEMEKANQNLSNEIVERKKAESALKMDEKRLESLLELSMKEFPTQDALVEHALEEGVRLTNSMVGYQHFFNAGLKTLSLYQWSKEVLKECYAEKTPHYPLEEAGIWADCVRLRKPVIHNDYMKLKEKKGLPEGHFHLERHMSVPIFDSGNIVGVAGVGNKKEPYDESDSNQLSLFMNNMWHLFKQKSAEKELIRTKEQAETANKAKSIFLANMSHEIRTPMNAILGYAQIMMHDVALSEKQRENLGIINRSGKHLLDIINDILEMSKIEAGRIEITPNTFNLQNMLQDVIQMFMVKTTKKEIELYLEVNTADSVIIHQDEPRIRQVLINLLGNSLKFTHEGYVTLRVKNLDLDSNAIEVNQYQSESFMLEFEVEDTGCGVPEKEHEKIFDAFAQTTDGRQMAGGTGLGLAISRKYARLMGGDLILAKSNVDAGSNFKFTVMVQPGKRDSIDEKQDFQPVIKLEPGQPEINILIVDDRYLNRDILSQMLTRVGIHVHIAKDGKEAVELTPILKPDCILMDVRMPIMDGGEATKQIKALPEGRDIPVIAVSASALEEQQAKIIANGAVTFIKKPIKEEELFENLRRHLGLIYVYKEKETNISEETKLSPLNASDIMTIPEFLREEIYLAVVIGNIEQLKSLIQDVNRFDSLLAERLGELLEKFELKTFLKLFNSKEESGGDS